MGKRSKTGAAEHGRSKLVSVTFSSSFKEYNLRFGSRDREGTKRASSFTSLNEAVAVGMGHLRELNGWDKPSLRLLASMVTAEQEEDGKGRTVISNLSDEVATILKGDPWIKPPSTTTASTTPAREPEGSRIDWPNCGAVVAVRSGKKLTVGHVVSKAAVDCETALMACLSERWKELEFCVLVADGDSHRLVVPEDGQEAGFKGEAAALVGELNAAASTKPGPQSEKRPPQSPATKGSEPTLMIPIEVVEALFSGTPKDRKKSSTFAGMNRLVRALNGSYNRKPVLLEQLEVAANDSQPSSSSAGDPNQGGGTLVLGRTFTDEFRRLLAPIINAAVKVNADILPVTLTPKELKPDGGETGGHQTVTDGLAWVGGTHNGTRCQLPLALVIALGLYRCDYNSPIVVDFNLGNVKLGNLGLTESPALYAKQFADSKGLPDSSVMVTAGRRPAR